MIKLVLTTALGCTIFTQTQATYSQPDPRPSAETANLPANLADLPAAPRGTTTIFGGSIRDCDPVRDQLTLDVVGQRPMRILFDERTQVFRDGIRIPLHDLGRENYASVETTLDGSDIFAVSVHILSQSPEGQYEGKVLSYDPSSGTLTMAASASHEPLKVFVSINTKFTRFGQRQFTSVPSGARDLARGSLISIEFQPQQPGHAVASAITVLAVPGSRFSFSGSIVTIDLHSGLMVLVNSTDQKSYQISFNSTLLPRSRTLHSGDRVMVTAAYNGTCYMASSIAAD